jgi:hypothetical protein
MKKLSTTKGPKHGKLHILIIGMGMGKKMGKQGSKRSTKSE